MYLAAGVVFGAGLLPGPLLALARGNLRHRFRAGALAALAPRQLISIVALTLFPSLRWPERTWPWG